MESEIARIAWRMEALAAELESAHGRTSADVPSPASFADAVRPMPPAYAPAAQNWFANVMQASAMGVDPAATNREISYLADVVQRTFLGFTHRLDQIDQRLDSLEPRATAVVDPVDESGTPEESGPASIAVDELLGGIAHELDALDAKLDACTNLQHSVSEVGEQLHALVDRMERLEHAPEEPNPLLEALVESAARFQLLDAKLDASLESVSDVARLVERLEADRPRDDHAASVGASGESGENVTTDTEENASRLAVLEDLPFDDRVAEGGERWGIFRRSTP